MGNPVVHFEITGPDAPALQAFYRDLFGWNIDANNAWRYGMVITGGEQGINGGIGSDAAGQHRVTVYTALSNLQDALDKAVALGAEVLLPPLDMGETQIALFRDPAGNVAGLVRGE